MKRTWAPVAATLLLMLLWSAGHVDAQNPFSLYKLGAALVSVSSGNKDTGTLRVTLATDQVQLTNKLLVTPDSVALPANQSVNVAQMNGVTVLMGAGATGTGAQRVNGVSDSATGAAPPASAAFIAGLASGATGGFLTGITVCDTTVALNMTTATTTEIVALTSGRKVRVCSYAVEAAGATTATWKYGTGSNCGTGTTSLGAGWEFTAQTGMARGAGLGEILQTIASNALCLTNSAAVNLHAEISYTVY